MRTTQIPTDMLDAFHLTVDCSSDRWTLRVAGSLDLDSGRQLRQAADVLAADLRAAGGPGRVDLDLSALDFVDTAGLHAVARTCQAVRAAGGQATVVGPTSPAVERLLRALDDCGRPVELG